MVLIGSWVAGKPVSKELAKEKETWKAELPLYAVQNQNWDNLMRTELASPVYSKPFDDKVTV